MFCLWDNAACCLLRKKKWVRNKIFSWKIFKNQKRPLLFLCNFLLALEHILTLIIFLVVSAAHSNHQWLRRQRNICSSVSPLSILNYIFAIVFLTNHYSETDKYHLFNCQRSPQRFLKGFLFCGNSFKWNKWRLQRRLLHLTELFRA